MSVAHFKLLYQAERSSVSISIEDRIPKPFLKIGDRAFELECSLKQSTDLQYQIFEDDEPKEWGYIDTSEHAATYGIIDMQASKSSSETKIAKGVLEPLCIKSELSSNDDIATLDQAAPNDGSLPDLGHSDTETESSELDAPLTPNKTKDFLEGLEGKDELCTLECKDIKSDSMKSSGYAELPDTLYINNSIAMSNTNTHEVNQLYDRDNDMRESAGEIALSSPTHCQDHREDNLSVNLDHARIPEEDEFDDRCVVDDMVAEMQQITEIIAEQQPKSKKPKAMNDQQIQSSLQHMPQMSTADLLKLEPMFASFVMVIVLQVFANAFSFAKAYTN
ncbi:hypothetical protein INT43_008863 [Umbelopsis isabellina]|uniref:Uncharacterized protein n=1 Tax=Mortierella isabellina TaxID=91625 RepID=A0A8H7UFN2_MORIS|nr:hypothetical protein INT43_008863 [Umbelopsis isabellina]